jgi:hypothetical protein
VEKILDAKVVNQKLMFLVKWSGWPESESSWEGQRNLIHAKETIEAFYRDHPTAVKQVAKGRFEGQQVGGKTGRKVRKK